MEIYVVIDDKKRRDFFGTKKRLTEWGIWCRYTIGMGLGFGSRSLIFELQQFGGEIVAPTETRLAPDNPEAEEIEHYIELLHHAQPTWAKLLAIHYAAPGDITAKIKRSELSKPGYFRALAKATLWMDQQLSS